MYNLSRVTSLHLPLLITTLLLCGNIQLNPSPRPFSISKFSLRTYNICLLLSNDYITTLHDLIDTRHSNLIALTEAWVNSSSTHAILQMLHHKARSSSVILVPIKIKIQIKHLAVAQCFSLKTCYNNPKFYSRIHIIQIIICSSQTVLHYSHCSAYTTPRYHLTTHNLSVPSSHLLLPLCMNLSSMAI